MMLLQCVSHNPKTHHQKLCSPQLVCHRFQTKNTHQNSWGEKKSQFLKQIFTYSLSIIPDSLEENTKCFILEVKIKWQKGKKVIETLLAPKRQMKKDEKYGESNATYKLLTLTLNTNII